MTEKTQATEAQENRNIIANTLFRLRRTEALISDKKVIMNSQVFGEFQCIAKQNKRGNWDVQFRAHANPDTIIASNIDLNAVFGLFVGKINATTTDDETVILKPGESLKVFDNTLLVTVIAPTDRQLKRATYFIDHPESTGYSIPKP